MVVKCTPIIRSSLSLHHKHPLPLFYVFYFMFENLDGDTGKQKVSKYSDLINNEHGRLSPNKAHRYV